MSMFQNHDTFANVENFQQQFGAREVYRTSQTYHAKNGKKSSMPCLTMPRLSFGSNTQLVKLVGARSRTKHAGDARMIANNVLVRVVELF